MTAEIKYRGRTVTAEDIAFIRQLIAENPEDSRRSLSVKLCREWGWIQANGAFRDMVCRGLMLMLHRKGYITLPERKQTPRNPFVDRKKPERIKIDPSPLHASLSALPPLTWRRVRNTEAEALVNGLIETYHYLGYCHPVGEHLKYLVFAGDQPVACFVWSSAARHIGCRDRFIGWTQKDRTHRLHYMAYNSRFLILPWVRVPHLASHLLGRMARMISDDWENAYRHPVWFLETFVDTDRFTGVCYKAANWRYLGDTTGRGKNDQTHVKNRSIKAVWGYPLVKDFRERMMTGEDA